MADFPPQKNSAFIWYFFIRDADGDPTPGATSLDVEFSIDGGVFADVAGTEVDEGEGLYSCPITAAEMNGDVISLICKTGTAGAKTAAQVIYTATRQLVDLSFPTVSGRSIDTTATGAVGIDWANVENQGTAVDLSATDIQLADTVTTLTGHTAQTGDNFARLGAPAGASVSADVAAIKAETVLIVADTNELQTDWTNAGRLDAILDIVAADVVNIDGAAMRGTDSALLATSAPTNFGDLAITVTTGLMSVGTNNDKTGYALTVADKDDIVDRAWDEVLTGATHNVVNSSGRRLRQLEAAFVIASGTAQAGTSNTITLAAGESSTSNIFDGDRVIIVGGTGVGEHGIITAYDGSTKIATMSKNWVITPDVTSEYDLVPADVDIETIEHSAVAADNLMVDYDGTGYDKANSTIGTTTTNTDMRGTDSAFLATNAPTNFSDLAVTVTTGQVTVGTNNDKTGYSISGAKTTLDALNDLSQAQILSDATPFAGANINNLPEGIQKNAAFNDFSFPMYDDTDGRTAKTGLSITAQRSIDGGSFEAASGSVAEIGSGMYVIDLLAADTNGDSIIYRFTGTGADPTIISVKTSP